MRAPETCRGSTSSIQESTGQCMYIRKISISERDTERKEETENLSLLIKPRLTPVPISQTGKFLEFTGKNTQKGLASIVGNH